MRLCATASIRVDSVFVFEPFSCCANPKGEAEYELHGTQRESPDASDADGSCA